MKGLLNNSENSKKRRGKMKKKIFAVILAIICMALIFGQMPVMAAEKEKVKVSLLTTPMGTGAYFFSFKLAEEVNRTHPWLRIEVKEGMGTVPQMKSIMNKPELGKTTVWNSVNTLGQLARNGTRPFKKSYSKATGSKLMLAFNTYPILVYLGTTKPGIKSIHDLAGKRVVLAQKGMTASYLIEKIFAKTGMLKKIKKQYMGFKAASDALRDGLTDAAVVIGYLTPNPKEFSVMAAYHELFNIRNVTPVSLGDPKVLNELVNEGVPVLPAIMPAGTKLMGKDITSPVTAYYQGVCYYVDAKMKDELVYEVTKSVWDHLDALKTAHPSLKVLTREKLGNVEKAENYHPGAVKFFKEKGIRIGFHGL